MPFTDLPRIGRYRDRQGGCKGRKNGSDFREFDAGSFKCIARRW